MARAKKDNVNFENSPVFWFSIMDLEAGRGNFEKAAEAKRELERLGVIVKLRGKFAKRIDAAEKELTKQRRTLLTGEGGR